MTGAVSDLMFQIIARDLTRASFEVAGRNFSAYPSDGVF